jgi:P-type E1-E2 ATPase
MKSLRILTRARPEDKHLLVTGLKELGQVVAYTGAGLSDAPALKKADVGIALGINGSDVAKYAADIISTDDNFSSTVKVCMWGRNMHENMRKCISFQLTATIVAIAVSCIGSCLII